MSVCISDLRSGHLLVARMRLAGHRSDLFPFFADAHNLEAITPAYLHFRITTPQPIRMREGTIIDYRLRLHGLPMRWRSEISAWQPPYRFVDQQLRGPYRSWIHEHVFEEDGDATMVIDRVRYAVPLDGIAHRMFVERNLRNIFQYRQQALRTLLSNPAGPSAS